MTTADIARMAREAGFHAWYSDPDRRYHFDCVTKFAALVISHHGKENRPKPGVTEREWLQQIAYQHGGIGDLCQTEFEFGAMVAAAEREAIAKHIESKPMADRLGIIKMIRARGTND